MKVNQKALYLMLKQQKAALELQLNPAVSGEKVNEIPENFNQTGWDVTIEKIETLLSKMKDLRKIKGNRLTPQFYRSIYNRALIGIGEIDRVVESLNTAVVADIDFESEVAKLNAEIYNLNIQVAEKAAADAAAVEAAAAQTAVEEALAAQALEEAALSE